MTPAVAAACAGFEARGYERAARLAQAGLRDAPESAELHGVLAASLLALAQPAAALAPSRRARQLAASAAWPPRLEALVLVALGQPREAIAAAEEAVRRAPDDPWSHDALARALGAARRRTEARTAALRAVALAPRDADLVRLAGDAWLSRAPDVAEARYRQALGLDPRSALALDALAGALERQDRTEEAAAARRRAGELDRAFRERERRKRMVLPLVVTGATLLLTVIGLGLLPRLLPARAAVPARGVAWLVAVFVPALFALGAVALLRRLSLAPAPPDAQLRQLVSALGGPAPTPPGRRARPLDDS